MLSGRTLLLLVGIMSMLLSRSDGWSCDFQKQDVPTLGQLLKSRLQEFKSKENVRFYPFMTHHLGNVNNLLCSASAEKRSSGVRPLPSPTRWQNATIPYIIDDTYPDDVSRQILDDIRPFMEKSCLKFRQRSDEPIYLRFVDPGNSRIQDVLTVYEGLDVEGDLAAAKTPAPSDNNTTESVTGSTTSAESHNATKYENSTSEGAADSSVANSPVLLVRSTTDVMSKTATIQASIMNALGFKREEIRYDRDKHINIEYFEEDFSLRRLFAREMKTALDVKFTYDSQSVTHMTIEEAQEISVGLSSKDNMVHPIKVAPDHKLSEIDIQKINYIYCNPDMDVGGFGSNENNGKDTGSSSKYTDNNQGSGGGTDGDDNNVAGSSESNSNTNEESSSSGSSGNSKNPGDSGNSRNPGDSENSGADSSNAEEAINKPGQVNVVITNDQLQDAKESEEEDEAKTEVDLFNDDLAAAAGAGNGGHELSTMILIPFIRVLQHLQG